jgi:two-component system LytT family response regulator
MISAIIIEDEKSNIDNLILILHKYCSNVEIIATAENVITGIDVLKKHKPDLVFLDIEMPFGNGFEILESLPEISFEVIFITAYNHYAVKAIKFCALDYLLKPINVFELQSAIDRVEKVMRRKAEDVRIQNFVQNLTNPQQDKKIALPTSSRIDFFSVSSIIRCKGENTYTSFFIVNHNEILVSKNLKEYEQLLSEFSFIRVHQSHLVNVNHVKAYDKSDGGYLVMSDNSEIPVSRQKKDIVQKELSKIIL